MKIEKKCPRCKGEGTLPDIVPEAYKDVADDKQCDRCQGRQSIRDEETENIILFAVQASEDLSQGASKVFDCPICDSVATAMKSSKTGQIRAACTGCGLKIG